MLGHLSEVVTRLLFLQIANGTNFKKPPTHFFGAACLSTVDTFQRSSELYLTLNFVDGLSVEQSRQLQVWFDVPWFLLQNGAATPSVLSVSSSTHCPQFQCSKYPKQKANRLFRYFLWRRLALWREIKKDLKYFFLKMCKPQSCRRSAKARMSISGPFIRDGWKIRPPRINWHHSWLFELTRRHSWCQLILGGRIFHPSLIGSRDRYNTMLWGSNPPLNLKKPRDFKHKLSFFGPPSRHDWLRNLNAFDGWISVSDYATLPLQTSTLLLCWRGQHYNKISILLAKRNPYLFARFDKC